MAAVMPQAVKWIRAAVSAFEPERNRVVLEDGGRVADRTLIVAPGIELKAIVERLKAAAVAFHLSEVKGPVMDRLQRCSFLSQLTGEVFLSQYHAMARLDPETTRRAAQGVLPRPMPSPKVA